MSQELLDHVVAGALFDFGGFLTTRRERIVLSAADNASPMVSAITEFMTLRGVDQQCEPMVQQWQARCSMLHLQAQPSACAAALLVLSKAMLEDPGYAWSWHCNVAVAMQDEGAPHDAGNAAAARFMRAAFGVDTSNPPTVPGSDEAVPT